MKDRKDFLEATLFNAFRDLWANSRWIRAVRGEDLSCIKIAQTLIKMQLPLYSQVYSSLGCYSPTMSFLPQTHIYTPSLLYGTSFERSYSPSLRSVCWPRLLPSSHRYQWSDKRQETWTNIKGCTEDGTGENPTWISVRGWKYTHEPASMLADKGRRTSYCYA